jgi:hypothetical protein
MRTSGTSARKEQNGGTYRYSSQRRRDLFPWLGRKWPRGVHHERDACLAGNGCSGRDARDIQLGVADDLDKDQPGYIVNPGDETLKIGRVDEAVNNAEVGERVADKEKVPPNRDKETRISLPHLAMVMAAVVMAATPQYEIRRDSWLRNFIVKWTWIVRMAEIKKAGMCRPF